MDYEIIETEFMGETEKHVVIERDDGSKESFPVNDDNPRYQQWLAEGNEPELIEDVTTDETQ
jgi:hypothetical protein